MTSDVANATDVTCSNSKCVATQCANGFDLSDGTCEKHICSNDEHKCEASRFYTCSNNSWGGGIDCPDGCTNSGCIGHVCSTGDHKCENGKYHTCSNNSWDTGTTCEAPAHGSATCSESGGCGFTCNNGFCTKGTACADIQTDSDNCGSCGNVCNTSKVAHASAVTCDGGSCKATACTSPYAVNNGTCNACVSGYCYSSGSCLNTQADMNNCGSCGNVCNTSKVAHSSAVTCDGGSCKATACTSPYALNNGTCNACESGYCYSSGSCLNTQTDMNNCGSCGNVCNTNKVAHSSAVTCDGGSCKATACTSPYALNNGTCNACESGYCYSSGSCLNTQTDMSNCGSCGNVCNTSKVAHSSAVTCNNGVCEATACESTYRVSNGTCICDIGYHTYENICEANTIENCGSHDSLCSTSSIANSLAVTCDSSSGRCWATRCKSGYSVDDELHRCMKDIVIHTCDNDQIDCNGDGSLCCPCSEACQGRKCGLCNAN